MNRIKKQEAMPEFSKSEYFRETGGEIDWRLAPEAGEELKKEFERYYNTMFREFLKEKYSDMEVPYYTWMGMVVDISDDITRACLDFAPVAFEDAGGNETLPEANEAI